MWIGNAREALLGESLAVQRARLREAGCQRIYEDTEGRARSKHGVLSQALDSLSQGDILVIWRLDMLGLNLRGFIKLINEVQQRQIGFRSLADGIDTQLATSPPFFLITAALDEMERNLRREQTEPGRRAARAQRRTGGRPKSMDPETFAKALDLYGKERDTVESICSRLGIARRTFYRYRAKYAAEGKL